VIEVAILSKRSTNNLDAIRSVSTKSEPSYHASYSLSDLTALPVSHSIRSQGKVKDAESNNSFQYDLEDEFVVAPSESLEDWIENDTHLSTQPSPPSKAASEHTLTPPRKDIDSNKDYLVEFLRPPLGLTLARGKDGSAEVTKIKADGQATALGIMVGDTIISVADVKVNSYHEAMATIDKSTYPLTLILERGAVHALLHQTGNAVLKGSTIITSTIRDELGLAKKSILDVPASERLANRSSEKAKEGIISSKDNRSTAFRKPSKRTLPIDPANEKEYDVTFTEVGSRLTSYSKTISLMVLMQGELGLRLEEQFVGAAAVSVVVQVSANSQAHVKGVHMNSFVVGMNGEYFISHAHTIACLKHTRPIRVRFARR
jgi:hypothetical protein